MAKSTVKRGANKTELTTNYVAKHPNAGLNEIVDGLKGQGVKISRSLASKIKYGTSSAKRSAKKGRRTRNPGAHPVSKNGAERGSKVAAIRSAAKSLGKKVRPRDVIAMLKEQGIEVSPAQVSTTLRAMGMRRTRRGRKVRLSAVAHKTMASSTHVSITNLIAVKRLVEQLGGIEQTKTVVSALAKLS
jgi:hypothetical protein